MIPASLDSSRKERSNDVYIASTKILTLGRVAVGSLQPGCDIGEVLISNT